MYFFISSVIISSCVNLVTALPPLNFQLGNRKRASETKYMFVFGDSYSRLGFDWSGNQPSTQNPIGNPSPYPPVSSSGAYNWVEFLTSKLNSSLLLTYDIAVGGATVDIDIVNPSTDTVDFVGQVTQWDDNAEHHQNSLDWTSDNTLFAVWFGVNDVNKGFDTTDDLDSLYEKDINEMFQLLIHLYDHGAKNFAILSLPPIHRSPEVQAYSSSDQKKELSAEGIWNSKLESFFSRFTKSHDVNAHLIDTGAAFNEALDNPTAYGSPSATCTNSDGQSCLWHDSLHPGQAIHKLVAEKVASDVTSFFSA